MPPIHFSLTCCSLAFRDMVVLITEKASDYVEKTLQLDGWRVLRVPQLANPGKGPGLHGFPSRFWGVYTKLLVFKLTQYQRGEVQGGVRVGCC